MREKISLPESYYKDEFKRGAEEAVADIEGPGREPLDYGREIGLLNLSAEGPIEDKKAPLAREVVTALKVLAVQIEDTVQEVVKQYCREKQRPFEKILGYIETHNLRSPSFKIIADSDFAKEYLTAVGGGEAVTMPGSLLVVFNLPRQVSRNWWKGGTESWGAKGVDDDFYIRWGDIYRKMMPVVWNFVDTQWDEGSLGFERINEPGQHEPDRYYYIWEVWKQD